MGESAPTIIFQTPLCQGMQTILYGARSHCAAAASLAADSLGDRWVFSIADPSQTHAGRAAGGSKPILNEGFCYGR
jgi:hypothetical protein